VYNWASVKKNSLQELPMSHFDDFDAEIQAEEYYGDDFDPICSDCQRSYSDCDCDMRSEEPINDEY
jgi:hypothetical protein